MENSKTTRPLRVRPKVLLWTLLVGQIGLAIFSFIQALVFEQKASTFDASEPQMHMRTEAFKSRINTNTDIAQLRTLVINFNSFDERDKSYRYYHGSQMWFYFALLYAFTSAILAFVIFRIRDITVTPNTAPEPTAK
jgi:hypothetical protein